MTITPDTAKELLDGFVESWEGPDEEMYQAAPDMAETIAGMTEEWGVEWDSPHPGIGRLIEWPWGRTENDAQDFMNSNPTLGNPRLVRRLVSAPEVIDGE